MFTVYARDNFNSVWVFLKLLLLNDGYSPCPPSLAAVNHTYLCAHLDKYSEKYCALISELFCYVKLHLSLWFRRVGYLIVATYCEGEEKTRRVPVYGDMVVLLWSDG